jgi:hypothetical protein
MDAEQRQTGNNSVKIAKILKTKVFFTKKIYFIEVQQV